MRCRITIAGAFARYCYKMHLVVLLLQTVTTGWCNYPRAGFDCFDDSALDSPMGAFILKLGTVTAGMWALHKAILRSKSTRINWIYQPSDSILEAGKGALYAKAADSSSMWVRHLMHFPLQLLPLLISEVTGSIL